MIMALLLLLLLLLLLNCFPKAPPPLPKSLILYNWKKTSAWQSGSRELWQSSHPIEASR
jgi:hypothetical protein